MMISDKDGGKQCRLVGQDSGLKTIEHNKLLTLFPFYIGACVSFP